MKPVVIADHYITSPLQRPWQWCQDNHERFSLVASYREATELMPKTPLNTHWIVSICLAWEPIGNSSDKSFLEEKRAIERQAIITRESRALHWALMDIDYEYYSHDHLWPEMSVYSAIMNPSDWHRDSPEVFSSGGAMTLMYKLKEQQRPYTLFITGEEGFGELGTQMIFAACTGLVPARSIAEVMRSLRVRGCFGKSYHYWQYARDDFYLSSDRSVVMAQKERPSSWEQILALVESGSGQ